MNPAQPRRSGTYELPRGAVVGKYEIMRRLAIGGMAEIYLARVTGAAGFEKLVVLKRILPSVAEDPAFVQMFLDEAKLAATLRHPNIADVYDVGEDDGTFFFTMEYVYGQDVRSIRHDAKKRDEVMPLGIALAIVHGTASALDHAHEKLGADGKPLNLVHRDVSASNIMVSYDGAVKLLDFGIARAASSTHKTQTGTLKGKVPYMSPEQCKGFPLDRRSDLFSLGTVFYEATVGRRPFRGESDFEVMEQIVHHGTKLPSEVVTGYPPELEAIVMKLLERQPTMRYPTGEDLLHDLDAFIAKHGLWMSPRAIGKYMRTLFADKIQAWEQAEQEGVPFATHVARTITSESMRSELLTPPSSIAAVGPRTTAEQIAAIQAPIGKRASAPMRAMDPLPTVTPMPLPEQAPPRDPTPIATHVPLRRDQTPLATQLPAEFAAPKAKSGRTILIAFAGALVLGVGGLVGFMMSKGDKAAAAQVEKQEPPRQMIEVREPAPAPAAAPTPADAAKDAEAKKLAAKKAEEAKKLEAKKAEEAKKLEEAKLAEEAKQADQAKKAEAAKLAAEAKQADQAKKAEEAKQLAEAKKAEDARKREEAKKKQQAKPKPKPEPKEQTWDPNSPFLPQR